MAPRALAYGDEREQFIRLRVDDRDVVAAPRSNVKPLPVRRDDDALGLQLLRTLSVREPYRFDDRVRLRVDDRNDAAALGRYVNPAPVRAERDTFGFGPDREGCDDVVRLQVCDRASTRVLVGDVESRAVLVECEVFGVCAGAVLRGDALASRVNRRDLIFAVAVPVLVAERD